MTWLDDGWAPPSRVLRRDVGVLFDGNASDSLMNWIFPLPTWTEMTVEALEDLMIITEQGDLGWAVFPPAGYRL